MFVQLFDELDHLCRLLVISVIFDGLVRCNDLSRLWLCLF